MFVSSSPGLELFTIICCEKKIILLKKVNLEKVKVYLLYFRKSLTVIFKFIKLLKKGL